MPNKYVAVRNDGTVVKQGDLLRDGAVFHSVTRPAAPGKNAKVQVNGPLGTEYYAGTFGLNVYPADVWARMVIAGILTDNLGAEAAPLARRIVSRLQADGLIEIDSSPLKELTEEFPAIAYLIECGAPATRHIMQIPSNSAPSGVGFFCTEHTAAVASTLEPVFSVTRADDGQACQYRG
jgi:hypothetical protein